MTITVMQIGREDDDFRVIDAGQPDLYDYIRERCKSRSTTVIVGKASGEAIATILEAIEDFKLGQFIFVEEDKEN